MALQSRVTECIGAESLEETWELVGSGGFGCVYKAKHKEWKINVAIKLLDRGVGLRKEADIMDLASCEYVLRVYGLFRGRPPIRGMSEQQGIVMEFMRRGSVESLQKDLGGPPPWPLAFRLAHEVALGLNFLHSKNLVHSDLKPSNVLLNDDFHAKLADFGLSRVSTSVLINNGESTGLSGGTYKYMPPEAFGPNYKLVRSFDIYSYGIFLWSVLTGKEPYEEAYNDSQVALTVPRGERPSLDDIDQRRSEGLKELVELMPRCWDGEPTRRPDFKECLDVTEKVFLMHEKGIPDAVSKVLTRLGTPGVSPLTPEQPSSHDTVDLSTPKVSGRRKTEQPSSHDTVDLSTPENSGTRKTKQQHLVRKISDADKAKFVDDNRAKLIQSVSEVMAVVDQLGTMVHPETYSVIESKPTSQDKMRELFQRTFRSGGEKVKAAFYDILREDYPDLVTSLGGEL